MIETTAILLYNDEYEVAFYIPDWDENVNLYCPIEEFPKPYLCHMREGQRDTFPIWVNFNEEGIEYSWTKP